MIRRLPVSNRTYFYTIGFLGDFFNFQAILAEAFFASKVLNATELQLGILGGCSAFGYTVTCILTGLLSERLGRRLLCTVAVAGMSLAYIVTPFADSMGFLYAVTIFRSMMTAFLWPPLMAWMVEISPYGSFSGFLGWYNVAWASGQLAGFGAAGYFFEHFGSASPFYVSAVFGIFALLFILITTPSRFAVEEPVPPEALPRNPYSFIVEGLVINTLSTVVLSLVLYMFPKVVGRTMGETAQGALHVIRVAGTIAAFFIMTHTTRWHFRQWPAWFCVLCFASGAVVVSWTSHYPLYVTGFAVLGLGTGVSFMMCAYYSLFLAQTKGLGSGVMETFIGGGSLVGPLYGGVISRMSTPRIGIVSSLIPVGMVGLYLLFLMKRPLPHVGAKTEEKDS